MFFNKHPLVDYKMGDKNFLVVNVTRPLADIDQFTTRDRVIDYTVTDGDTPITIADNLYDDPLLDWTIMYINNIFDYYSEWPMTYQELIEYVNKTYNDPYDIHHYESRTSGAIVSSEHPDFDRVQVLNIEHEQAVNDAKRQIVIIDPTFINSFINAHNRSVEAE